MKTIAEEVAHKGIPSTSRELIWSEEFDSGTAPDDRIWSYDVGNNGWGNRELQTYTRDAENVRIEDSHLLITAVKKNGIFTSARVHTEDKFSFMYGTVEARIQVPDLGNGLWPALWALGHDYSSIGWPACGEIILMEMGVGAAIEDGVVNRRVMSAAHWENNGIHKTDGVVLDHPDNLYNSFHLYRMEWTPSEITTYIDNRRIWTLDISNTRQFHAPHFLLLNLAVGGEHTGICNPAGITAPFPAEYRVDYIRVFDNGSTSLGGSSVQSNPAFE